MDRLLFFSFVISFSALLACGFAALEIQVEGPDGWAKNLYCWWWSRSERKWMHGQSSERGRGEVTSYHLTFAAIGLMIFHFPLVGRWTLSAELICIGGMVMMYFLEDILWFIINPWYGLRKLNPENVPWHKWWGRCPVPVMYVVLVPLSITLLVVGLALP